MVDNTFIFSEPTKAIPKELETEKKEESEEKVYIPEDSELVKLFTDPDNPKLPIKLLKFFVEKDQYIDTINKNGNLVDRYRRDCLRCDKIFVGHTKWIRSCTSCKALVV